MSTRMYSLHEASLELRRLECEKDGHSPAKAFVTFGSNIAEFYVCDCGTVKWLPRKEGA
jgi:hypothetical protein